MRAYAAGDRGAFDELFERHVRSVLHYMRRDLWTAEDANDLTQQAFLQLHRSRRDFRLDGNLRAWLMTIARNVKYDYMRRVRRRPPTTPMAGHEETPGPPGDERRVDARDALEHALAQLPENQRVVIRLHWLEHQPYAEIARQLDVTESAVKVRAHRAYKALRALLDAPQGDIRVPKK